MREANIVGGQMFFRKARLIRTLLLWLITTRNAPAMADHSVRNREILYLCVAGEASIIAPDIIRKRDAFD